MNDLAGGTGVGSPAKLEKKQGDLVAHAIVVGHSTNTDELVELSEIRAGIHSIRCCCAIARGGYGSSKIRPCREVARGGDFVGASFHRIPREGDGISRNGYRSGGPSLNRGG